MRLANSPHPSELGPARPLHGRCGVCDCAAGVELGRLRYALLDGSVLASEYDVVCCEKCGFVFCDTPSQQKEYDRFYEEYCYSPSYLAHQILPEEEQYFRDILDAVASYLRDGRALFDVGCGAGKLLEACRHAGYECAYGIDPSSACIERLRALGFHADFGTVSRIPFAEVEPGVIVLSHIVEHLLDMRTALSSVHQRLTEGAAVYVEVPDAERYSEFAQGSPLRFFYFQHVVHFDQVHLDNLFHAHGYRKVSGGQRVRIENELKMPALWSIYERAHGQPRPIVPDFRLAHQIRDWFAAGGLDREGTFASLAQRHNRVYVWGIGIHVQLMLGMSPLRHCNIVHCVDQDPKLHQRTIAGHRIVSTDVLRQAGECDTIVIGSIIHRQKMLKHLRENVNFRGEVAWV